LTVRNRTANMVGQSGTYYRFFFGVTDSGTINAPGVSASCTDVVGNYPFDNPLQIDKVNWQFRPVTTHVAAPPNYQLDLVDYIPQFYRTTTLGHLSLPALSDPADATKIFAGTNPSRATVDLAATVGELRELPAFLFQTGKRILRRGVKKTLTIDRIGDFHRAPEQVGSTFLAWQYGWKPLIADLKKVLDFQAHVLKREQEIKNLYSKGGLSRTFQISTDRAEQHSTNTFVESYLFTMYSADYTISTERRRWGSARWLPDHPSLPPTDAKLHDQAKQAVLGLSLSPRTAWELIPWSWLIDWCSSVGNYLESERNTVGATCAGACLMTHTRTTHTFRSMQHSLPGVSGMGEATCVVETKQRSPYLSPVIFADIPFLGRRRESILGALALQRTKLRR